MLLFYSVSKELSDCKASIIIQNKGVKLLSQEYLMDQGESVLFGFEELGKQGEIKEEGKKQEQELFFTKKDMRSICYLRPKDYVVEYVSLYLIE